MHLRVFTLPVSTHIQAAVQNQAPSQQDKHFTPSHLPSSGGDRALLGIATFDSAVQFYALRPGQSAPQMLVVPDILEPYAPSASSLLVNAHEARGLVSTTISL